MPDGDVATIRDLIHHQNTKIIAKNAFAASDGESRLKYRGGKMVYDSIPPLLPSAAATTAHTFDIGDLAEGEVITVLDIGAVVE
jgi:hypothetical protein